MNKPCVFELRIRNIHLVGVRKSLLREKLRRAISLQKEEKLETLYQPVWPVLFRRPKPPF